MKWLNQHPEVWAKLRLSDPSTKSSEVKLISDGQNAEVAELAEELKTIPLYAWILPAKKIPEKYNRLS